MRRGDHFNTQRNSYQNSQYHQVMASQPILKEYVADQMQGAYYSPPTVRGSLGTPNLGYRLGCYSGQSGSYGSRRSLRRSAPGSCQQGEPQPEDFNVVLVATRPLLKTLARECRPWPPWCVGFAVPENPTEELRLFASFLRATPEEITCSDSAVNLATEIMQAVWPTVVMKPMATTAAGLSPLKDVTLHYYAQHSPVTSEEMERVQKEIQNVANSHGAHVEFATDYRDVPCVVITDTRSGRRLTIRYGPQASYAEHPSNIFRTIIVSNSDYHATLTLLDALLRQNKILDDTGTIKDALNGEALLTMVVAIINSYSSSDVPDANRLMMDFFLTYGFAANFDLVKHSVTINGMSQPTPKVHHNAQISVLDPLDETRNLTPKLEKAMHLQAVFNYCYTALSQFTQVSQRQRRAQSTLSTIIGGEAYWGRVLQLYHEGISPYVDVVEMKKHILVQSL
ncbi:hypothetical protein TraAM80_03872 [Trypanosoma rangeli]|uniref:Uncharacterized protein n=1 Tax=Trypanosoma rangeli TaxID=5698 RepID=A0A422NLT5_TRYRA|nr:uncharacterized protein TraAM80_03872 [Trypanosoma rangeli]RNF06406.1 hypothetical protein TraAM80_03872 [Trypanosoma rangeli]|eukprot:RNF06406.1 hypothetical protein TraAM80_03872 [Trypanosoma rangeli]